MHHVSIPGRPAALLAPVLLMPALLAACTVPPPTGPMVLAMPGQGKDLQQFQTDQMRCRDYASASIGYGSPTQAANNAAVGSAVAGTAIGAAAGALLGAAAGNPGAGAAIGAGTGLVAGTAIGANNANASAAGLQGSYDAAYAQCMVAAGNTIQGPPPPVAAYPVPAAGYAVPYAVPYVAPPPVVVAPSVGFGFYGGYARPWYGPGWGYRPYYGPGWYGPGWRRW